MDEDYDELMGPRPGQDMRKVFKEDDRPSPLPQQQDSIRRTSSNSGPPPTLFHSMPDRWAQHDGDDLNDAQSKQSTSRRSSDIMSFDEEEDERGSGSSSPQGIRQEALRMLEVAESGNYSVHRTVTGGFMAEPRSLGNNKRVPTALAGLGSFATGAARSSKPRVPSVYRDDPPMEEDYEYDDSRFASQQAKDEPKQSSSSWSSRYSVDDTLLAMSGGSVKTPKKNSFLDKLDMQNERRSARNMFMASPSKETNIFGSGFNFRQKSVFGKQGATSPDNNLRTVWMDAGASNSPARSWMDDLKDKQSKRRKMLIIAALLCAFLVALVAILGKHNKSADIVTSASKTGPNGEEALFFYVTSDVPYTEEEDALLTKQISKMSSRADFMVHLGSIQDPDVTQCEAEQYEKVADILMKSSIPVFVLPGQQDWANCPDQDKGWFNWVDNFMEFDEYFDKVRYFWCRPASRHKHFRNTAPILTNCKFI